VIYLFGESQNVAVRIDTVGRPMPPVSFRKRADLTPAGLNGAPMAGFCIVND
jgi:hypothetical protein